MPKIQDKYNYNYCNYCKHFRALDYTNKYKHGLGICDKKSRTIDISEFCWYQNSICFEFTIQNRLGFNSPKELEEYKDRHYIVNALRDFKYKRPLKDRIIKKYERLKKIITSLHHD